MGKSDGNIIRIKTLEEKRFNPLAYRYFCLGAHYRSKITFSWKALEGAQNGLKSLQTAIKSLKKGKISRLKVEKRKKEFLNIINDDLNTPKAMAFLRKVLKDKELNDSDKYHLVINFDKILGLNLGKTKKESIPEKIKMMMNKREEHRIKKEWAKADKIRKKLKKIGYNIEDLKIKS